MTKNTTRKLIATLGLLLMLTATLSCNPTEPKTLPVAQWQFIDAETMKPIEGVFVNFAWRGKSDSRGMTTCMHGVLGRSDKDGWFRHQATDPNWWKDGTPTFFAPGYEYFDFKYAHPDPEHITAYIELDETRRELYKGFEPNLIRSGYRYHYATEKDWGPTGRDAWVKEMPIRGFHDRSMDVHYKNPRRYLIKAGSLPERMMLGFVGRVCDSEGATNEVDSELVDQSDYLRGLKSTRFFCRSDWDGLSNSNFDFGPWISRALWLLNEQDRKFANANILSEFSFKRQGKSLLPEERRQLCTYVSERLRPGDTL